VAAFCPLYSWQWLSEHGVLPIGSGYVALTSEAGRGLDRNLDVAGAGHLFLDPVDFL
jgi:hypothetical protein